MIGSFNEDKVVEMGFSEKKNLNYNKFNENPKEI